MPRYTRRRSLKSIIRIAVIPTIALLCIIGLFYAEHTFKKRQQTWTTVEATAEDTRVRPMARFALEYGSKDLYEIDVLATYTSNGTSHQDWVPFSEKPKPLNEAKPEAAALKGKPLLLRWDPAVPDQKLADPR